MKGPTYLICIILLILLNSCAKNLVISYQEEQENTGKIVLKPVQETARTFVTVNDKLVVDKKLVKSVTIKNVPAGTYEAHFVVNSSLYKERLNARFKGDLEVGETITKIIELPPYTTGYYLFNFAALAGLVILIIIL